ncbi:uncharacterized protein LY89DRAFT_784808 [Mollisia scopiformis]|uniref:SAP domain-containing protein n=1 Tax=Mollisia scopiformis TaxID=149040 RepID=A0A194X2C4_MOLSC|nr:uncharacterized protein LY89DRAFT_784808 [Mollisia scopiformis]KUJ13982.1 hypothetical protein LY89DRAFT_784808 [Mollisia scopiformis]
MPRANRILAEADPNASNASKSTLDTKPTKRSASTQDVGDIADLHGSSTKKRRVGRSAGNDAPTVREQKQKAAAEKRSSKKKSQHATKDNSKLQFLLAERGLSTDGTREDWIERLEASSIDYESYTAEELTEMLRRRHMKGAAQYPKAIKIERLKLNDDYHRDTRNGPAMSLWIQISIAEVRLERELAEAAIAEETDKYSTLGSKRLCALLETRGLSTSGKDKTLLSRLRKDDEKKRMKSIKDLQTKLAKLRPELEAMIGHSVSASDITKASNRYDALDNEITSRQESKQEPVIPVCDYNWKDSHWASRTERELSEICSRREMPGHGPKAAMIKFLDTGAVEYEDLYAGSLEMICYKRGIHVKSGAKKNDLVRILKEADEGEHD